MVMGRCGVMEHTRCGTGGLGHASDSGRQVRRMRYDAHGARLRLRWMLWRCYGLI